MLILILYYILNANNINPTWDIVLKANNIFIMNCVKPTTVPIIGEIKELYTTILGLMFIFFYNIIL